MKTFKEFLKESIIDPKQPTLSPQIFENPESDSPEMKSEVRDFILAGIDGLSKELPVLRSAMIGSTTTQRYQDDADLDVNIQTKNATEDVEIRRLRKIADDHSGKLVPGTKHPVNFHLWFDDKGFDRANEIADGVFDVVENKFLRTSIDRPFDISEYFSAFKKVVSKIDCLKDELRHDLIDYEQLKSASPEEISGLKEMIKVQIDKIEMDVEKLAELHHDVKQDRRDMFARDSTPEEIKHYGIKNRFPENVIYKLLERYHYLTFLDKIDKMVDDKTVDQSDIELLRDLLAKQEL